MRYRFRPLLTAALIASTFALAGCEDDEEKAARYFLSGMSLLKAGDQDRAMVEFRNVFKYDGFHKEARKTYADTLLERGQAAEAYGQYLRLIEQYPDTVDVRLTLAELALRRNDWQEVDRHGRAAQALDPEDPAIEAIAAALDYRAALQVRDDQARDAAVDRARAVLDRTPDNLTARRILINHLASGPTPMAALPEIDRALEFEPDSLEFNALRFRLLAQAEDMSGSGEQLKRMFELFPDNQDVRTGLIRWYLIQNDFDGAESFLRQIAGAATDAPEGHLAVVQLLQGARGGEAARAELDRLIAANAGMPNGELYRATRAALDFGAGRQTEAITELEDLLRTAEPSEQTRRIKATLAQMLIATGNPVGARARVEEILAEDASNVEALKMRAGWLIDEDKPGEAIVVLRTALSQSPRDSGTLTLMALAHERDGSLDLAGERLAVAVEVSGSAPEESIRYAQFLLRQGRGWVAQTVLNDARRVTPTHVGVLGLLAEIKLGEQDWPGAQEIVEALRGINSEEARQRAQRIQAALLQGQGRTDETLAFLQDQIGADADASMSAIVLMLQSQIRSGEPAAARTFLDSELEKAPDNLRLRLLSASLHAIQGEATEAEELLRGLIVDVPQEPAPVRLLYNVLSSAGRSAEATGVLDAALEAQPESTMFRFMKAGEMERVGDFDGAIAIYESLYAANSSDVVIANNLASLITTHRSDAESLERAFAVARRLRGSNVPAFQDTYGWIEYRRGNHAEALSHLEPAAAGLPNEAMVQYHLGMTYAAMDRREDAVRQLTRALEIAGDSPLPQFDAAREKLRELNAAP